MAASKLTPLLARLLQAVQLRKVGGARRVRLVHLPTGRRRRDPRAHVTGALAVSRRLIVHAEGSIAGAWARLGAAHD